MCENSEKKQQKVKKLTEQNAHSQSFTFHTFSTQPTSSDDECSSSAAARLERVTGTGLTLCCTQLYEQNT